MVFCCTELSAGGEKYLFLRCSGEELLRCSGANRNPNWKFFPALKQNWGSCWNFNESWTRLVTGSESQLAGTTIFTWEVLLEAPASMQWCRAGLSGSAAVTKTLFYMLRVNSACALPLVALPYNICSAFLALGRQEETVGIHTEDRRWPRLGGRAGWRNSFPVETRSPASVVLDYQKKG